LRAIARQIRIDVHHNGNLPRAPGVFPGAATARATTAKRRPLFRTTSGIHADFS
jgi:hypothetical protein